MPICIPGLKEAAPDLVGVDRSVETALQGVFGARLTRTILVIPRSCADNRFQLTPNVATKVGRGCIRGRTRKCAA